MEDLQQAAEKVASFMRTLTTTGGMRLKFRITAGAGAQDPIGFERRDIFVEVKGPDADLLTENDGELLRALEHVSAKMLRLESEDHDRVSFEANGFKAARAKAIQDTAEAAIDEVDETDQPFHFQPMSSRERRMLHMYLKEADTGGMQTSSSGEGPRRHVVLYPEGFRIPVERPSYGDRGGRGPSRGPSRGGYGNRGRNGGGGGRGRY